jgi:hypothetical protein
MQVAPLVPEEGPIILSVMYVIFFFITLISLVTRQHQHDVRYCMSMMSDTWSLYKTFSYYIRPAEINGCEALEQ